MDELPEHTEECEQHHIANLANPVDGSADCICSVDSGDPEDDAPASRAEDWPRGDANVPPRVQEALDAEAATSRADGAPAGQKGDPMDAPDSAWGRFEMDGPGWAFTPHIDVGGVWMDGLDGEVVVPFVAARKLHHAMWEGDKLAEVLERIAAIDPYNMPADETCPSREAQNWATLNGCVSWAREALAKRAEAER